MKARPYQEEAMAAVCREFQDNSSTLLVMATGLGKTVVFSSLLAKAKRGRCSSMRGVAHVPMGLALPQPGP